MDGGWKRGGVIQGVEDGVPRLGELDTNSEAGIQGLQGLMEAWSQCSQHLLFSQDE